MKIIVLGGKGQLGICLAKTQPDKFEVSYLSSTECSITNQNQLQQCLSDIDIVINAAAYTNVDGAEKDIQKSYDINDIAVGNIAKICKKNNIHLIHISTDFVFDGNAKTPYKTTDKTSPISVYGKSKLAGEKRVEALDFNYNIIRTSWLYSPYQNNFVKTMLRLMDSRDEISVVCDEIGSPTNALSLADFIWSSIAQDKFKDVDKILHYCNFGEVSRYDFAVEINRLGVELCVLKKMINISKCTAVDMGLPAKRPGYSALDCGDIDLQSWQEELRRVFKGIYLNKTC